MKNSIKNILLVLQKTKIMNNPNMAPKLSPLFVPILLILGITHDLNQGSVNFKLELNKFMKTEITVIKQK